jgi:23S rRNA (cytidine1920-2'-O)/16S rRNA (cytidine1409-2'-O)-methyltransferase
LAGPGRKGRRRLDERVVAEGLAESRSQAQGLILSGVVLVDDVPVDKAGFGVPDTASIRVRGGLRRFVSRGGDKLAGALEELAIDPQGLGCLDVGASTGGFTDCLLQAGAERVIALDVGHGQLHSRLRIDPRVEVVERFNARELSPEQIAFPVELVVADVSFISLSLLMPAFARAAPGAEWLLLVKPQFEVGREQVGKGGVVRDDSLRESAVSKVIEAAGTRGYAAVGRAESQLPGPRGNREIFVRFRPRGTDPETPSL